MGSPQVSVFEFDVHETRRLRLLQFNGATVEWLAFGMYSEEEAIKRLLPQRLRDQYAFKTDRALDVLTFSEVVMV